MDIGGILKKVGGGIIKQIFPAAGVVVDIVNELLPGDKKLPADATGDQVQAAVNSLPADQQAQVLSKQLDVEITEIKEWSNVVESLAKSDATGSSTRPFIAAMMAWATCFAIVVFVALWGVAVYDGDEETLKVISDGWPLVVAILATPTALLRSYFGMRTDEKKARYAQASGQQHISGFTGLIGKLLNR